MKGARMCVAALTPTLVAWVGDSVCNVAWLLCAWVTCMRVGCTRAKSCMGPQWSYCHLRSLRYAWNSLEYSAPRGVAL